MTARTEIGARLTFSVQGDCSYGRAEEEAEAEEEIQCWSSACSQYPPCPDTLGALSELRGALLHLAAPRAPLQLPHQRGGDTAGRGRSLAGVGPGLGRVARADPASCRRGIPVVADPATGHRLGHLVTRELCH